MDRDGDYYQYPISLSLVKYAAERQPGDRYLALLPPQPLATHPESLRTSSQRAITPKPSHDMQNPLAIGQSVRERRRGATRRSGRLHIRRDDRSGEGTVLPFLPGCGRLARSTHSTLRTWAPPRASKEPCYTKAHGGAATKTMTCQLTEILSTYARKLLKLKRQIHHKAGSGPCSRPCIISRTRPIHRHEPRSPCVWHPSDSQHTKKTKIEQNKPNQNL